MSEGDVRQNNLRRLAEMICKDFHIGAEQFYSRHARGRSSKARHVFVLAAFDNGYRADEIEPLLTMHDTFVAQVLRRNYALRKTAEYYHAYGMLKGWLGEQQKKVAAA